MGIRVRKMVAVGHLVHKYDEIICSIHQGGHPASHHDPDWFVVSIKQSCIVILNSYIEVTQANEAHKCYLGSLALQPSQRRHRRTNFKVAAEY